MFRHCAGKLTSSLVENNVISAEDFELYSFGFEMTFAVAANILTTLLIGILFRMPLESLLFLTAFIPLRSYAGGFHASGHFRCYWLSTVAVIAVLFATRFVLSIYSEDVVLIIGFVCAGTMFVLVPVQDSNRPLEDIEIRVFRRRAKIVLCVEVITMAASLALGLKMITAVLFCTLFFTCVSACAGALKNCIKHIK